MSGPRRPELAVIVPVRNEGDVIEACLRSILADAPAGGLEVVVVDGESDDGTADVVRRAAEKDSRVRLMTNPARFVPQALNMGIAATSAPFVGRIDGHCRVQPGYFEGCLERLRSQELDGAGGCLINEGEGAWGKAIAAAVSSPVGVGSARFRTGRGPESLVDTLAFAVYRREVFDRIGLFDEAFVRNQDDEFNLRLVSRGGRLLLAPSLRIVYRSRGTLSKLARQYFQYGYWKWWVVRKHGRFGSWRQVAPSAFVLALALGPLLAWLWRPAGVGWLIMLAIYGAALLAEGMRSRRRGAKALRTALALATLHASYGSGLLLAVLGSIRGRRAADAPTTLTR